MHNAQLHSGWAVMLNVDVVGYSALMARDEVGTTLALLRTMSQVEQAVRRFGGRVIDQPGDNLMAEFAEESAAFACALSLQRGCEARNRALPSALRMQLRIGIDSGPVLRQRGKVWGQTVNVSARLQSMSEAGGVLVSGASASRMSSAIFGSRECSESIYHLRHIPGPVPALQWRAGSM
jgi:adenylate cyclase